MSLKSVDRLTSRPCSWVGRMDEESNEGEQDTQRNFERRDTLASFSDRAVLTAAFFIMAVLLTSCFATDCSQAFAEPTVLNEFVADLLKIPVHHVERSRDQHHQRVRTYQAVIGR